MKNIFAFLIIVFFIGCQKETLLELPLDEQTSPENTSLIVSELPLTSFSGLLLKFFTSTISNIDEKYTFKDVSAIKIIYRTRNYKDEPVEASGVLLVPDYTNEMPVVSLQHGTLSDDNEAPSNSELGLNELTLAAIMASTGMLMAVPDYIGYGNTNDQMHPYEHRDNLAQASYDFILAVNEYLETAEITTNEKLFLTGYSEGGYATMALHQLIEKENALTVTHAFPGAGAYNKTAFTKEILTKDEELPFMTSYIWVLNVYNSMFENLKRPWSSFLNEPYASNLENLERFNSPVDINLISTNPKVLFNEQFIEGIINNSDTEFLNVLAENDVFDWLPKAPITLFHGTADDYVYPLNSITAKESIENNGGTIMYEQLEGLNHSQAAIPFYIKVLELIDTIK